MMHFSHFGSFKGVILEVLVYLSVFDNFVFLIGKIILKKKNTLEITKMAIILPKSPKYPKTHKISQNKNIPDENQQAFKDPLHVPVGPITRARSKKIKESLNGLIQEIWADSNTGHSKLGPKEDESVINLIQAIKG